MIIKKGQIKYDTLAIIHLPKPDAELKLATFIQ